MSQDDISSIAVGDLSMAYREVGQGAPVVILHGAEGDHRVHDLLQDELASRFRTLSFDQRDCGHTRFLAGEPAAYTLRDVAADAIGLLDALGCDRAHIVGISLGGLLAQIIAVNWPRRVDRLVLGLTWSGSFKLTELYPEGVQTRARLSQPGEGSERGLVEFMSTPEFVAAHPQIIDQLRALRVMPSEAARQRRFSALAGVEPLDPTTIRHETLVLAGERDQLVPPALQARLAALLPSARLETIPHAGHLASRQSPELMGALIKEFLDAG
jgi:pimeloyl-ACP methyl ester carboxylesterase